MNSTSFDGSPEPTAAQWTKVNVPRTCPFCGHKPSVELVNREGVKKLNAVAIKCINGDCEVRPSLGPIWNPRQSVVAIWNSRKRKS